MTGSQVLIVDRPRPQVAVLTLNRPDRLNALTEELVDSFTGALSGLAEDPTCRVVVVTGSGRGFCAGIDLKQDPEGPERTVVDYMALQDAFSGVPRAIRDTPQPVIAAVNGPAAGGGMALALACDVRVASASASFHVAAVKLGLSAGECGISYHLPRYLGTARAFEVMLTGRPVPADEAERFGLVSRVVPDGEVLDAALDIAGQIVELSPIAVRMTKQIMWRNLENDFEDALALENRTQVLAAITDDAREATAAFVEKRAPRFTGA